MLRHSGFLLIPALLIPVPIPALAATPIEVARQAYDLRMGGKEDQAVHRLEEGLAADSTQAVLYYELSRTRMYLMDFPGMQSAIEKAVALDNANAEYHYFAALASSISLVDASHRPDSKQEMQRFGRKTLDELQATLRCDPDHADARCMLVQQTSVLGKEVGVDAGPAEEQVRILEKKDPVMGAKARSYLASDAERADLWEAVVRDHPDDWRAWYEAASGFLDAGKPARAAECLDRSLEMHPEGTYLLLRLGTAFALAGNWDPARAAIQRYIDTDPPLPLRAFAWARLGQIEQRSGDSAAGEKLMAKAKSMDPHLWRALMPPSQELFTRP